MKGEHEEEGRLREFNKTYGWQTTERKAVNNQLEKLLLFTKQRKGGTNTTKKEVYYCV